MKVPTHHREDMPKGHTHVFHGSPVNPHASGAELMQSAGHCPECHHATQMVAQQNPGIAKYLPTAGQMFGLTFLVGGIAAGVVALSMAFAMFALAIGLAALALAVVSIVIVILIKEMRRDR